MSALDEARFALTRARQELLAQLAGIDAALAALCADPPVDVAPLAATPKAPRPRRAPAREEAAPAKAKRTKAAPGSSEPVAESAQGRALAVLRAAGSAGLLYAELAERAKYEPGYVRQLVAHLHHRGLVRIEGPHRERRAVAVGATEDAPPGPEIHVERHPAPPSPSKAAPEGVRRVVAVEFIAHRLDRFKCLPLACTITAETCVDRQKAANSTERGSWAAGGGGGKATAFQACKSCSLGRQVAAKVEAAA